MPLALWPFFALVPITIYLVVSFFTHLLDIYICCEFQAPWLADTALVMGIQEGGKTSFLSLRRLAFSLEARHANNHNTTRNVNNDVPSIMCDQRAPFKSQMLEKSSQRR